MSVVFWLITGGVVLLLPTAYAAKIGAPYVPVFVMALNNALDYVKLGREDVLVDLGAGDGKVLLAARKRGARAIGYELSPIMWFIAGVRSLGKKKIRLKLSNFYRQEIPPEATVLYAFLLPETMDKLRQYLSKQKLEHVRAIIIYAFPFKDIKPVKVLRTPKCARMFVYEAKTLR